MIRRFLYMVDHCHTGPSLSNRIRRFNPSHLFYPNDTPLQDRAKMEVEDARLPPPAMTLCSPGTLDTALWMEFMRRNDDKIVGIDHTCRAILYDPAAHTLRTLPAVTTPKLLTISVAVGDDLYVMEMTPRPDGTEERPEHCFEALVHREIPESDGWKIGDNCLWRPLPPPPCVNAAHYEVARGKICGYAVVGDTHILISTSSYGTYSFDTASSAWTKSGDWRLPFRGRAEHVPEHGLWLGFSDMDNNILGAWNLSSPFQQQPMASLQLKGFSVDRKDLAVPEVYASQVVHLGAGKLCVAKMFGVDRKKRGEINFVMLTGVEVVRGRGGKLRIVKHKSCRYNFGKDYTPGYLL